MTTTSFDQIKAMEALHRTPSITSGGTHSPKEERKLDKEPKVGEENTGPKRLRMVRQDLSKLNPQTASPVLGQNNQ